jgi:hypothetical protein
MKAEIELADRCAAYVRLLELLSKSKLLGDLVIYPAIGLDCLVTLFAKAVIGLNWHPYDSKTILDNLRDELPSNLLTELAKRCSNRLMFVSRVDASCASLLKKQLELYRPLSPKSLLLKSCYEYLFSMEWDADAERFYGVAEKTAKKMQRIG